jgi:hypothetical protein
MRTKVFDDRAVKSQPRTRRPSRVAVDNGWHSEPENQYSSMIKRTFDEDKETEGGPEFFFHRNGVLNWRRLSFDGSLDSDVEEYVSIFVLQVFS